MLSEWILKLHSTFLLEALGAGKYDVSIVCTGDREIQALNRRYRREDAPTDVLSFPYHENLQAGQLPLIKEQWDSNLGDIILGVSVIQQTCGVALKDRLAVVVAHGLCHLLGYHHDDESNTKLV